MKRYTFLFGALLLFTLAAASVYAQKGSGNTSSVLTNDDYNYVAGNQILMWIGNNGDGSHDPSTDNSGLYWPGGSMGNKALVFEDGLIFGGKVGTEIRVNGSTYRWGLQAGKILENGTADDPSLEKYRVYKIRKDWHQLPPGAVRDAYQKDWEEWPIEDGAPWVDINGDGVFTRGTDEPKVTGVETLWYAANDMDPARSTFTYGTLPMGLEFQTTVYAYDDAAREDMVFKKYLIINKGGNTIEDMYLGYWSDPDLGDAGDDYSGCDTGLDLAYCWNGNNNDDIYGAAPPAVGYVLLQGPIVEAAAGDSAKFLGSWRKGFRNLPMTAFTFLLGGAARVWRDPIMGVPEGAVELYNYLAGYLLDGAEVINPVTGQPTKYALSGDPVSGTGWYEGTGWPGGPPPGNRRHLISTGTFTMAPGDTQEVVIGIAAARGTDNLNSITELKKKSSEMIHFYDNSIILDIIDEAPVSDYAMYQNYPNPFNPATSIEFEVPNRAPVTLKIYDLLGVEVAELVNGTLPAGKHKAVWNAAGFPSGVYFYRIESGSFVNTKKLMLIK